MTRKSNSIWHPQWMYPWSEIIPGCLPTLNHQREDKCDIQTCLTNSHLILVCIQVENSECHKPGSGNASYQRSDVREGPKCIQMSVLWAELFGFHLRFPYFSSASIEWQAHFAASLGAANEKISLACCKNWSNYNGLCRKTSKTKQSRNKGMGVSIPD